MAHTSLQKLHKAFQDHAKDADRERRRHDRQLYEKGRMVEAAGFLDAEEALLKGMLAMCADDLSKMRDKWIARGIKELLPIEEAPKYPARATFAAEITLSKQARTALAAEGLKEIRKPDVKLGYGIAADLQLWSGHVVDYVRADSVVSELGGTLRPLGDAVTIPLKDAAE
jgi:hypothetical protein